MLSNQPFTKLDMRVNFTGYQLLSIPVNFRLSWGKLGFSRHLFVTLESAGHQGFGEGVLYKTTHLALFPFLKKLFADWPEKNEFSSFSEARDKVTALAKFEPGLAFALDTALWDLEGKITNQPAHKLLGGKPGPVALTEEIFIEDEKTTLAELSKIMSRGTKSVKLKVGQNLGEDARKILLIKKAAPKMNLKLDANRGFTFSEALKLVSLVGKETIAVFEEPINGDCSQLASFRGQTGVKVMLDESIQSVNDLSKAIEAKALDIFNLKLTRVGGITKAQELISLCEKNHLAISLGCNEETEIGMAAILHLAVGLKDLYAVEGIGADRLGFHSSRHFLTIKNGQVTLPLESGVWPGLTFEKKPTIFQDQSGNDRLFLAKEFVGVWKTRLENLRLLLWKK